MDGMSLRCIDREKLFTVNELFFSTTDPHGVIRFGNHVFTRVSGYPENELFGFAHSRVRHPDMPAAIFRLFWNTLKQGESIAAFVKNRSKDGEYYWVMAVATPIPDGYLSIRLKPTSELLPVVTAIYKRLRLIEIHALNKEQSKEEAIALSTAQLQKELLELGFKEYTSFMRYALSTEMSARQKALQSANQDFSSGHTLTSFNRNSTAPELSAIEQEYIQRNDLLGKMLEQLTQLKSFSIEILAMCKVMMRLSEDISMVAMNAKVAADSKVLEAISGLLATAEQDNRRIIVRMNHAISKIINDLDHLAYEVSVAALQGEIALEFVHEVSASDADNRSILMDQLQVLIAESAASQSRLSNRLENAADWFNESFAVIEKLNYSAKSLRYIRTSAVTESAHLSTEHSFCSLFDVVKRQIERTSELSEQMRNALTLGRRAVRSILETDEMIASVVAPSNLAYTTT